MKKLLKTIYNAIPFKRVLFRVIKLFGKPDEAIYKHLHFNESYTVRIDKTRKFKIYNSTIIENEIFWEGLTGKWEKESIKLWLKLCEISNIIFDIGANTGVYALVAKTVNPKAKVYAFEPHPHFNKMLQRNIKINNYDIKYSKNAVSNFDGELIIEDYSRSKKSIKVESITLDTFIKQNGIEKIDLIKIDVEAHEPQVLEGFLMHLSKFRPTFLI